MKTSLLILVLLAVGITGCDSNTTEPAAPQLASKGSSFVYTQDEFDADGNQIGTTTTTYVIDSANIALDARTDVMRATASNDTMRFARDGSSILIYREAMQLFDAIGLPKRWKQIVKSSDTGVVNIGTYTGKTHIDGMAADITIRDREQYLGTSTITLSGKTFEVVSKSFSVQVEVYIIQFGITATTTVTEIDGYAPDLGFLVSMKEIRTTDSEFSPIQPGRTELQLSSCAIK